MTGRRALLAALIGLPLLPLAAEEAAMRADVTLDATDGEERIRDKLARLLTGQPLAEVARLLREAGARDPGVIDLARPSETGADPGTDLGDGIRAGDPVLAVTFGLRRGFLRGDRRIQADLDHDGTAVTGLRGLRMLPK